MLCQAPSVVGIGIPDDGWLCAALRIAGREPVWVNDSDPGPAQAFLRRMGLPDLGVRTPEAIVSTELQIDGLIGSPAQRLSGRVDGPLVTILICTFNRDYLLPQAVKSALMQRWPNEIIVVDDGSDDTTPQILANTPGIRWFRQENTGKPLALKRGLAEAKGEAVLVLDDDDLLLPGALDVLATTLFSNPSLSVVIGDTIIFSDETGAPLLYRPATRLPGSMSIQSVTQQVPGLPGASLVRMSAQHEAGDYDPSLIRGQDMDMYLRLARVGPIESVPLPTFLYRSHRGLRGNATNRFQKFDKRSQHDRLLSNTTPIFQKRYEEASPITDREEAHAWVIGLHLRDLDELAQKEAQRWPGPHSARECWVREQVGLSAQPDKPKTHMVVIDDGDPGALELTLKNHGAGHALWVNLEVPRDPLGDVRLYWPGNYAARRAIQHWIDVPPPWHIRLSSAPDWAPPPLPSPAWLPNLRARDAVLAAAAALGWPAPDRSRPGLQTNLHHVVATAWAARMAISAGDPKRALRSIVSILETFPKWPGGWKLAADAYASLGRDGEAASCVAKIELMDKHTLPV